MSELENITVPPSKRTLPAIGLRVVTGLILAAAVLLMLFKAPLWVVALVAGLVAATGFYEFARMTPGLGWVETILGIVFCAALPGIAWWGSMSAAMVALPIILVFMGFVCMAAGPPTNAIEKTALMSFGFIYIGLAISCLLGILQLPNGLQWAVFGLVIVAVTDMGGYFVGSLLGRHKLVSRISPNKTWEGLLGGLAASAAAGLLFMYLWPPMEFAQWWQTLIFSLVLSLSAVAGDLFESAIKRIRGVKDSGKILPGHGGMLDRMDSYLLAMPTLLLLIYVWPNIAW